MSKRRHRWVMPVATALIIAGILIAALGGLTALGSLQAMGPEDYIPPSWYIAPLVVGVVCIVGGLSLRKMNPARRNAD